MAAVLITKLNQLISSGFTGRKFLDSFTILLAELNTLEYSITQINPLKNLSIFQQQLFNNSIKLNQCLMRMCLKIDEENLFSECEWHFFRESLGVWFINILKFCSKAHQNNYFICRTDHLKNKEEYVGSLSAILDMFKFLILMDSLRRLIVYLIFRCSTSSLDSGKMECNLKSLEFLQNECGVILISFIRYILRPEQLEDIKKEVVNELKELDCTTKKFLFLKFTDLFIYFETKMNGKTIKQEEAESFCSGMMFLMEINLQMLLESSSSIQLEDSYQFKKIDELEKKLCISLKGLIWEKFKEFINKTRKSIIKNDENEAYLFYIQGLACWYNLNFNEAKMYFQLSLIKFKNEKTEKKIQPLIENVTLIAKEISESFLPTYLSKLNTQTQKSNPQESIKHVKKIKMQKKKMFTKKSDTQKILLPAVETKIHTKPTKVGPLSITNKDSKTNSLSRHDSKSYSSASQKPDLKIKKKSKKSKAGKNNQDIDWKQINWSLNQSNSLFNAYLISDPGKLFEIRPFPNKLQGKALYEQCRQQSIEKKLCQYGKSCKFAHNQLEVTVWNFMTNASIPNLQVLYNLLHKNQPKLSPKQRSPASSLTQEKKSPNIKLISDCVAEQSAARIPNYYYINYCRTCALKYNNPKELFLHRLTDKHLKLSKITRQIEFLVRIPPDLSKVKKEDLDLCPGLENGKCNFLNKDSYVNFCEHPHHPIERHEWTKFVEARDNTKNQQPKNEFELEMEEILMVSNTKRLKKMISYYVNDDYWMKTKLDKLSTNSLKIEECSYNTLWHRFINNEMQSSIDLVEKFEWTCKVVSKVENSYNLSLQFLKPYSEKMCISVGRCLMNLNNPRLTQYINIVKLADLEKNNILKLEIKKKIFKQTNTEYIFDINVTTDDLSLEINKFYQSWLLIDRSMFNMMHFAVDNANKCFLFPKLETYNIDIQENLDLNLGGDKGFPTDLTKKQKILIKRIVSVKTGELTPPMIVYGAFGTGKTKCIALAAEHIAKQSNSLHNKKKNKVLICTYSDCAAGTFFDNWSTETKKKALRLVRDPNQCDIKSTYAIEACLPMTKRLETLISDSNLIVTTFYLSTLLNESENIAQWFTHILIDESSYALECEVIMPLTLATSSTTVILVGDHKQLQPCIVNRENIEFLGCNYNLLERLLFLYLNITRTNQRHDICNYFLMLNEVHRAVREIVEFISVNFYNDTLIATRLYANCSNLANYYPIQFVEFDQDTEEEFNPQLSSFHNTNEADLIVFFVRNLVINWPKSWGDISIGIICIQSAQISLVKEKLSLSNQPVIDRLLESKAIIVDSIQKIQGLQFRVSLVSTVFTKYQANLDENRLHNYILSPFAANACLTRSEECLIVFGKQRFLTSIVDYFRPYSMQVFWKNFVSLCTRKKSLYRRLLANNNCLYFTDLKTKILKSKKSKKKEEIEIDQDIYLYTQYTDDFISNELKEMIYQTDNESQRYRSQIARRFVYDPDESSDSDADIPLSRRKTHFKNAPTVATIKSFSFEDKISSSRRRIILTAEDATSDIESDDENIETEVAEIILRKSSNLDNMNTDNRDKAFYKYVSISQALQLVKNQPDRYKQCILEFESHDKAQAICQHDNSVYTLNNRFNCGTAYTGDECVLEIIESVASKTYARVIAVIERAEPVRYRRFICEPDEFEPYGIMKPIDKLNPKIYIVPKYKKKFFVYDVDESGGDCTLIRTERIRDALNLNDKMYLVVVLDWMPEFKYPQGVIIEVLEPAGSVTSGLRMLSLLYGLKSDEGECYSEHKMDAEALDTLNKRLDIQVKDNKRIDMCQVLTFTVDPEMSLDLDDAISFEKLEFEAKNYFKIGIHIADVSEYIEKDGVIDKEARKRGNTFYYQSRPHCSMLPKFYANHYLSLLPQKKRPALSLIFLMDENACVIQPSFGLLKKATLNVNFKSKYQIATTLISSQHKLSYIEAESYIKKNGKICALNDACSTLFELSEKLKKERYLNGHLMLDESKNPNDYKSHSLIEQFMILANSIIGEYLITSSPKSAIVRTQKEPDQPKLKAWYSANIPLEPISYAVKKYTHCSRRLLPLASADIHAIPCLTTSTYNFKNLKTACEQNDIDRLSFLIKSEMNYPACAVAISAIKSLTKPAQYLTPISSLEDKNYLSHFDLNIANYTHFTSPIRRYIDLVAHRLVKSILNSNPENLYSTKELSSVCMISNLRSFSSKKFDEKLASIKFAEILKESPLKCLAYISTISETSVKIIYPFMKNKKSELLNQVKYSVLSLCTQPKLVGCKSHSNEEEDESSFNKCSLFWSFQIFDADKNDEQDVATCSKSISNVKIDLQTKYAKILPINWWKQIHTAIESNNIDHLTQAASEFKIIDHNSKKPDNHDIKSNSNGTVDKQRFSTEFKPCDLIGLQLSSQIANGFLSPSIQLVTISNSIDFCIEHKTDPLSCYKAYATKPVKNPRLKYESLKEYLGIWLPLLYMETTQNSISNSEENFVIRNCHVEWFKQEACHPISQHYDTFLFGELKLTRKKFIKDFIDVTENLFSKKFNNKFGHPTFVLAYACIQYKGVEVSQRSKSFYKQNLDLNSNQSFETFTWLGHCVVTSIKESNDDSISIFLSFPDVETKLPSNLQKLKCSIEFMRKPYPDSVIESALRTLAIEETKITSLCKRIILGDISTENKRVEFEPARLERYLKECTLNSKIRIDQPNLKQYEAITNALSQEFTLIQGPPGTGKTITGVILAHCFFQHNRSEPMVSEASDKKILYVSASNRAVDVFGNYLVTRFKMSDEEVDGSKVPISAVRIYSQQIQNKEYPNPNFFNKLKSPLKKYNNSEASLTEAGKVSNDNDEEEYDTNHSEKSLRKIVLHHMIRNEGKPYATDLFKIDRELSIRREYEDRIRNRTCCCGNKLENFSPYNSQKCDHARYFKHANESLSMPFLLSGHKDNETKAFENKCIFLEVINLYHKLRMKKLTEEEKKTWNNIFENNFSTKTISISGLLDPYLDKMIKSNTFDFMQKLDIFLCSLEIEHIDKKIFKMITENTRTKKDYLNKSNGRQDFSMLKQKYAYTGKSNTNDDLKARFTADIEEKKKSINLEYFKSMLDNVISLKWSDIEDYENRLFKEEKKLFEKIDKNASANLGYNDLLDKACRLEIKRHDIILATCIVSHMKALSDIKIEQLIVDEAAMIKEPEVLVPIILCSPKKVVLIGDHKQLRCITKCKQASDFDFDRSLFERYHKNLTMLEEQYRMHPSICKFPSSIFYDKKLITGTTGPFSSQLRWPKTYRDEQEFSRMIHVNKDKGINKGYDQKDFETFRIVFLDVKGKEAKLSVTSNQGGEKSVRNDEEIKCTDKLFNLLLSKNIEKKDIKVLSPYRSQVAGIASNMKLSDANVSTVITSQGGEWNYVILSTTRTLPSCEINKKPTIGWRKKHLGFLTDEHQINVALTRAKRGLFIIGDKELLDTHFVWYELLKYLKGSVMKPDEYFNLMKI